MKQVNEILKKILSWRIKYISNKQFLYFLSLVIGIIAGTGAVVIKRSVRAIHNLLNNDLSLDLHTYLYFIAPIFGIIATIVFCKYLINRTVMHGIPTVLYSISKAKGILKKHNLYSSVISSALTVGFGGSVGLEGPTVATGAAFGSNIGKWFNLEQKQVLVLLGCGCSGAMSAIFKAPIAGVVFALEVIMLDISMSSIVLLLISSATGALTSYFFLGQNVLYTFNIQEKFQMADVSFYLMLGIVCGFVSLYFNKMYIFLTNRFEKIKFWYHKLLIGGTLLGLIIFLFPALFGEGYDTINQGLNGQYDYLFNGTLYYRFIDSNVAVIVFLFLVIFFKVIATTTTFGIGGVGGIFAPSLFVGVNTGLLFAKIFGFMNIHLSEQNFALVAMGGLISGVIHAPLTAIFLIAEITNGYDLFMPLMIVSTISYATIKIFSKSSVYTFQLAQRGELITHHRDKSTFILMHIEDLIESDFEVIHPDSKLKDLVNAVSKSKRNVFPIVAEDGTMVGVLTLNDIRKLMFQYDLWDKTYVRDLMYFPEVYVNYADSLGEIADKIESSGRFNVPVLKEGKYMGFVSRARVFSEYRKLIKNYSDE